MYNFFGGLFFEQFILDVLLDEFFWQYLDTFLSFNPARLFFWSYANSVNSKTLYECPLSFSGLKVACSQVRSTWFGSHRSNPRWQGFMIRDWLLNNLLLQWLEALGRSHQALCKFSRILSPVYFVKVSTCFHFEPCFK